MRVLNNYIPLDSLFLTLNSLITVLIGVYILSCIFFGKLERHPFYYLWSAGFILYGFEILTRTFFISNIVIGVLIFGAQFSFVFGMWFIGRRKKLLISYVSFLLITSSVLIMFFVLGHVQVDMGKIFASIVLYGGLAVLSFHYRVVFGKIADKFIFGWLLLSVTNFLLPTEWFVTNVFAILSKIILLTGVVDQKFAILTQKIEDEISLRHTPPSYTEYSNGGVKLVDFSGNITQSYKITWIKQKIRESISKNFHVYLFVFQDVVPYEELQKIRWISPSNVKIFLFSSSAKLIRTEFTVLPMDITIIGTTISELTKKVPSLPNPSIILMDLSLLIHVFGAYPIFNLLLGKIGSLRDSRIQLFAFIDKQTHQDKSIVALFESIADEIIKA